MKSIWGLTVDTHLKNRIESYSVIGWDHDLIGKRRFTIRKIIIRFKEFKVIAQKPGENGRKPGIQNKGMEKKVLELYEKQSNLWVPDVGKSKNASFCCSENKEEGWFENLQNSGCFPSGWWCTTKPSLKMILISSLNRIL